MIPTLPGVYTQEFTARQRQVSEVASTLPALIGYTEKACWRGKDLTLRPSRIASMLDYEQRFGGAARPAQLQVTLDNRNRPTQVELQPLYLLHAALQLFFANGGGPCYILSVGPYQHKGKKNLAQLSAGVEALRSSDEITLLLCPDAVQLGAPALASLQQLMLRQCAQRRDRFALLDLDESASHADAVAQFRTLLGTQHLAYGASYTPHLQSRFSSDFHYPDIRLLRNGMTVTLHAISQQAGIDTRSLSALEAARQATPRDARQTAPNPRERELEWQLEQSNPIYAGIARAIRAQGVRLPPSAAIAGAYARVDGDRGVWKAPANIALNGVQALSVAIDNPAQQDLNIDPLGGKSVNAIRAFSGRGILVWGARTLAGNDNEWRYIPVRRFYNQIEQSLTRSTQWAVNEANDANLWQPLRAMIDRYLTEKWRDGALQGSKPSDAFFIRVGLGSSMTSQDLIDGRLIILVGVALVRPAEFITLRISHRMAPF